MNANDYQKLAKRTLWSKPEKMPTDEEYMKLWTAIGIAGEAGEVCELIKKGIFHRHNIDVNKLKEELGDICWYIVSIATQFELDFGEVLQDNIDKLKQRFPEGFSYEDSIKRRDIVKQTNSQDEGF